jgi:hypothetical protein
MLGPAMPLAHRVLVLALVLASCAKKAAPDTATPASESGAPQSIDELEAELGRYEAELRGMGFGGAEVRRDFELEGKNKTHEEAPVEAEASEPAADEEQSSTRICDLAAAICGLQDRICGLASEHDGEERYADSCARATEQCDTATEACDASRG